MARFWPPRWPQVGPKIGPKSVQKRSRKRGRLRSRFWNEFGPILDRFWDDFGPIFGRFWVHAWLIFGSFWLRLGCFWLLFCIELPYKHVHRHVRRFIHARAHTCPQITYMSCNANALPVPCSHRFLLFCSLALETASGPILGGFWDQKSSQNQCQEDPEGC